jgi:hypothetical protein
MRGALLSLAGASATSIIRGIAWSMYNESREDREIDNIVKWMRDGYKGINPREVATSLIVSDKAQIKLGQIKGEFPPDDTTLYKIIERTYTNKGDRPEDKEKVFGIIRKYYGPGFTEDSNVLAFLGDLHENIVAVEPTKEKGWRILPDTSQKIDSNYIGLIMDLKDGRIVTPRDANYEAIRNSIRKEIVFQSAPDGLSPTPRYYYGDKRVTIEEIALTPGLSNTVLGSLGQSLFEFGGQTISMGLPYTTDGKMSAFAWNRYLQNAVSISRAASVRGISEAMQDRAISVGTDIISNNVLTTISNTPLGAKLNMAPFIPIAGYKGMPFTVALDISAGEKAGHETRFYGEWPSLYPLRPITLDPFLLNIKDRVEKESRGTGILPNARNNNN